MDFIFIFWIISTITVLLIFINKVYIWIKYIKENKEETFYIYDFIYTFTKTTKELKEHIRHPIRGYNFKDEVIFNVLYIFIMLLPIIGIIGLTLTFMALVKDTIEAILNVKIDNIK